MAAADSAEAALRLVEGLNQHVAVLRMISDIDHKQLEALIADEIESHLGPIDADARKLVTTAVRLTVAHIINGVTAAMDTA